MEITRRRTSAALLLFRMLWAQKRSVAAEPTNDRAAPASPQQPSPSASVPRLSEITVTAQRREEDVQQVPISQRVFSAAELEDSGVRRTTDLFEATPNLNFSSLQSGLSGARVFLRGGEAVPLQATEENIGFYVDDVYMGTPRAINIDLVDLERVEIVRGPQGTLSGHNALGGAIRLLSAQPDARRAASL